MCGIAKKLGEVKNLNIPNIILNGRVIEYSNSVKYLGTILQDTSSWSQQVI